MEERGIREHEIEQVLDNPKDSYPSRTSDITTEMIGETDHGRTLKVWVQTSDSTFVVSVADLAR